MAEYEKGKTDRSEVELRRTLSRHAFEAFGSQVSQFEAVIDRDSELGITIPGANDSVHIYLRNFALVGFEFICFMGLDTKGRNVRLIQYITQMNVMLVEVPKFGAVAFRIGMG